MSGKHYLQINCPKDAVKFLAAMDVLGSHWFEYFYSEEKRARDGVICKLENVTSKIEAKDKEKIIADIRKKGRDYLQKNPLKKDSWLAWLDVTPPTSVSPSESAKTSSDKKRAKDSEADQSYLTKKSSNTSQPVIPNWINKGLKSLGSLVGMNKEIQPSFFKAEKLQALQNEGIIKSFSVTKDGCKVKTDTDCEIIFNSNERKIQSNEFSQQAYDISAKIMHQHGGGFDMQELVKAAKESKDPGDIKNECLYRAYAAGRKLKDFQFSNLPNDMERQLEQRFQEESKENRQGSQRYKP